LAEKSTATVIVVDDDVSIRRALGSLLEILGFHVLVFQSAEELLVSKPLVDNACLLLDVYLPGMSGIELCQSLAASGRHLPTILMSGRDDEATRRIMSHAEPIARLFKPFDQKTLSDAIRKAMRNLRKSQRRKPLRPSTRISLKVWLF
jgi:two-component system response regulator FixJ